MVETDLHKMFTNELCDLMVIKINEMSALLKCRDYKNLKAARTELELIGKVIVSKRGAENNGEYLA
jgi:hypothetical protein